MNLSPFMQEQTHRLALVTGATGAIGKAIALQIARQQGYRVKLLCRDQQKAENAVSQIISLSGNQHVSHEIVDLSGKASIGAAAQRLQDPVNVLVNNAAITPRRREETPEGIELQFATNVLGYFWLTRALHDQLLAAAPARVVNVASYWAGDLDLDDLEFKRRPYNNNTAYRQSKQADRMLTVAFAQRLREHNVSVNACHPGDVNSSLSNNLGFGGHESPDEGARTPAWLATHETGQLETGKYFEHMQMRRCRFGEGHEKVEALYRKCMAY
jgi:NAD(P)-dependent dehydrogenase (short-subunit alcohol dehydrogenase family)